MKSLKRKVLGQPVSKVLSHEVAISENSEKPSRAEVLDRGEIRQFPKLYYDRAKLFSLIFKASDLNRS